MTKSILGFLQKVLKDVFKVDTKKLAQGFNSWSIRRASSEKKLNKLMADLQRIEPDLSKQYSRQGEFNDYWALKLRAQHAFQCSMMFKALEGSSSGKLTVADIGDSAGTHMRYLKELAGEKFDIDAISVNLDPGAVEKIKSRGGKALLARAEELDLGGQKIDFFTSFEMLEHLHDPAGFMRRLAKKSSSDRFIITVPYRKTSRVGLHSLRHKIESPSSAENEHIFELSPEDWTLLMLHSGWKVNYSEIYYQYPRNWPFISSLLGQYWKETDFEGFWGAIFERDTASSDHYQDWRE